jgi:hypothetical protein
LFRDLDQAIPEFGNLKRRKESIDGDAVNCSGFVKCLFP